MFPEIKKVFNNLCDFLKKNKTFLTVDVTGGEPLLHPDFWKILEMLEKSENVKNCGIITNGSLLKPDVIKKLNSFSKLKTLKVSCEGIEKNSFKSIRNMPYKRFIDILETFSQFQGEKLLMFTLLETNTSQIPFLFETVSRFSLDGFIVERFFPLGTGEKSKKEFNISRKTWNDSVKHLLRLCKMPQDLNLVVQYRGFKILKNKDGWTIFGARCIVGKDGCAIMHDGSVFPCRRFVFKMGNGANEPFEKILKKNPCGAIKRKMLKGICGICRVRGCYGCRALAYCIYGDYLAPDPLCFLYENDTS